MKNKNTASRILVIVASLLLTGAVFLPIWQIQLSAPQYPEGLQLQIYANGLAGDVEVINGLNHYIGMQTLHSEDFIEFTLLPYIIGGLVILGLLAAFVNNKKAYYGYIALFMLVAIISMVDFYRWEYNYGHELDPNAAIQVPGMSYQPPLIGYKKLLNFGAYSVPDFGGWLFIGAGLLLFISYLLILQPRWLTLKKNATVLAVLIFSFQSCSDKPQAIRYGRDACDFCKMTIVQKKFANEWVSEKGKVFRFDDLKCLSNFKKEHEIPGTAYVNVYHENDELLPSGKLFYVKTEMLKSPMRGNIVAFQHKTEADQFAKSVNGLPLSWEQVEQELLN